MADYWKSQPRKFCQYCKCWIADNKPSIEFHERGKNHKENVAAKIDEIKKKSVDKARQEQRMSKEFAAMEEAALKAYEEDIKRLQAESGESETPVQSRPKPQRQGAGVPKETKTHIEFDVWVKGTTDDGNTYYYNTLTGESRWEKPEGYQGESTSSASAQSEPSSGSAWMEALSPDGYTYYYNTETGESSWERPADFSPSEELSPPGEAEGQEESSPKPEPPSGGQDSPDAAEGAEPEAAMPKVPKISFRKRKGETTQPSEEEGEKAEKAEEDEAGEEGEDSEKKDSEHAGEPLVPEAKDETPAKKARKTNPYGEWESIQEEEDPYEIVDLQLPQVEVAGTTSTQPDLPPEPKPKFKERTITSLGGEGSQGATFRKRKTENGKSRSLRQRGDDD